MAVANVLDVNASSVILTFVSGTYDRRSQKTGVLVSAGVIDLQVSAASYASKVTQDKLNTEMAKMGLNYVQLVSITGVFTRCDFTLKKHKVAIN